MFVRSCDGYVHTHIHTYIHPHISYLDHEPVLVDDAVVGEAAEGVDALLRQVRLRGGRLAVARLFFFLRLVVVGWGFG